MVVLKYMLTNKVIFGFTGLPACGKGTAAKYLEEKYKAETFRFSTSMRDLLDRLYLPQSRDNMIKMSECIREKFGEDTFSKVIANDASNAKSNIVVVEGIRRIADIEHLSRLPNCILVEIFANIETRYERLIHRGENSDDATKTFEQFQDDHKRSTEVSIADVVKLATEHIDNNGNLEDLHGQLDELVARYV